jgi:hypothetical protein
MSEEFRGRSPLPGSGAAHLGYAIAGSQILITPKRRRRRQVKKVEKSSGSHLKLGGNQ